MVLESLLNPLQAERHPWEMFFMGILYSSIAVLLGLMIFGDDASLVIVFLTVLACVPLIYGAIKMEENKDISISDEKKLLQEHAKAISFLMYLFGGIVVSLALWYVFLPIDIVQNIFAIQTRTIEQINSGITGNFFGSLEIFSMVFLNNFKVLIFCLLFAFLYGVGAIFILVWNASVLAAAMGDFARTILSKAMAATGNITMAHYFSALSLSILRYSIHGVPEILSYFIGGLAGGIISIAVIKHDFQSDKFRNIIFDTSSLVLIAIFFLVIAAFLEVFVTPIFF